MKKLSLLLIFSFLLFNGTRCQAEDAAFERSIVILFDLSYSMGLESPDTGLSRLESARRALEELLTVRNPGEEWALIAFNDISSIKILHPFTAEAEDLIHSLRNMELRGLSPLSEALDLSRQYLLAEGKGERKLILLVSDCIATGETLFEISDPDILIHEGIVLYILGFPHQENKELDPLFKSWAQRTGGDSFTIDQVQDLADHLDTKTSLEQEALIRTALQNPAAEDRPVAQNQEVVFRFSPLGYIIIFFLPLSIILLISKSTLSWFTEKTRIKLAEKITYLLTLYVRLPAGGYVSRSFKSFPVTVGSTRKVDLFLPARYIQPEASHSQFIIERLKANALFKSKSNLIVNGVARKEKQLKPGDIIIWGRYRIIYKGITRQKVAAPENRRPVLIFQIPFFILLIAFLFILSRPFIYALNHGQSTVLPEAGPAFEKREIGPFVKPDIVGPEEKPAFFKADILFIHAHPDDESLDFGGLMAKQARMGRKIVTVLFTDGESGRDQFPMRMTGQNYPAHDLNGSELAKIRIEETKKALGILGSKTYIRLGLKNHPYNSIHDVLSRKEVLKDWEGEEKVIEKLVELLKGFKPDVVISPDLHSEAFEHFEHEAVGHITRKALAVLQERGEDFIKGYLVSIDPLQKDKYENVTGVKVMSRDPATSLTFRAIQVKALKEHITQRDASLIGVEVLPNFAEEYYQTVRWDFDFPVEQFFGK